MNGREYRLKKGGLLIIQPWQEVYGVPCENRRYAQIVDIMETRLEIDHGVMYVGSSKKYSKIMLMIMEDQKQTNENMVTLEVLKK